MASSGVLSIDLTAIQANWSYLASLCGSSVGVGAALKANAYGVGALEVGAALYAKGCREFFFANLDEALLFKANGFPDTCLYVLGGVRPGDEVRFIEANLIPVLFSLSAIKRWTAFCKKINSYHPCVIKIDTGMTRLGLSLSELNALCTDQALLKTIAPTILMSHLACADDHSHSLNSQQLSSFQRSVSSVQKLLPSIRTSLANSSGILLGSSWHFDLVRPGAALYGINPAPGALNPLCPVIHLALPVLQVRRLENEMTIGYGATTRLPRGSRVAVVAGGYADGLHRSIGVNPEGMLSGQMVKSVGRMSMDLTVFDVTDIELSDIDLENSFIDVINNTLTLDYLAQKNKALGYEILTSLGNRYKRIYHHGTRL